jgi:AcrR family transcriptional regulator
MRAKSKAEEQKRKILVVAAKLFHKKGYSNTSIDEIADRLRFNKATIYYYFQDKSHILFDVMCSALEGYIRRARAENSESHNIPEKMKALVKLHVSYETTATSMAGISHFELRNLPRKLAEPYIAKRGEYERVFRSLLKEGIAKGYFRDGFDPAITARFILGLINSITIWYRSSGRLSAEQIGELAWEFVVRAIATDAGLILSTK